MTTGSARFWDGIARRYAGMTIRDPEGYEATLADVRAHLAPSDRVLELGCGTGTTALKLADAVETYVASDYAPEMIAIAAERRAEAGPANVDLCRAQPGDGSLPEGPFDAILGFNILHLLPERPAALTEVAGRLRPGGLLISKTPCLGGAYRVLQPVVAGLRMLGKAPEVSFISPARLEQDIAQAGFGIVTSAAHGTRPPRRFIVARKR